MPNSYSNRDDSVPGGPNAQKTQSGASLADPYVKDPVEGSPAQPIRGQAGWQGTGKGPEPVEALATGNGEAISSPGAGPKATAGEWGAAAYDLNKGHTIPMREYNEKV